MNSPHSAQGLEGSMSKRNYSKIFLGFGIIVGLFIAFLLSYKPVFRFDGLDGPLGRNLIIEHTSPLVRYSGGAYSRLALLLTDEESNWLSLVHGLKTIGIPLTVTRDPVEALKHRVVMVYPTISGLVLEKKVLQALAMHPRNGGTLIGFQVLGGGLESLFGFTRIDPVRGRKQIQIEATLAKAVGLAGREETELALSVGQVSTGSYTFEPSVGEVLARYEDGAPAMVRRDHLTGQTYAFGFDIGHYLNKGYGGRHQPEASLYVNAYTPPVDVLLRILLHIYRVSEPLAITVGTVPEGKAAAVMITHDIDYTRSIKNAIRYAEYERSMGVNATYFIQTKYIRDWNDEIFYDQFGADLTGQLHRLGMEVASHSVSHSSSFANFPIGIGDESYPRYLPFVKSQLSYIRGTILGELRVSRFLLENTVPQLTVHSFRPGHLRYPDSLPQALEATGYKFSSSMTSGVAMTHLPFQLKYQRQNASEVGVYEFPITIEDELSPPMTARLERALDILAKLKSYGGMMVVLIHPNVFQDKFSFLQGFLSQIQDTDVWIGTLSDFGQWWAARDRMELDVRETAGRCVAELNLQSTSIATVLKLPLGWHLKQSELNSGTVEQRGSKLYLRGVSGMTRLHFTSCSETN